MAFMTSSPTDNAETVLLANNLFPYLSFVDRDLKRVVVRD